MLADRVEMRFRQKCVKGVLRSLLAGLCFLAVNVARGHISYSGRDFGSFTGLSASSKTITNQTVTGNYGWADAADGVLGDTHRGRAFRFHLDNTALVSLAVSANANATTNSLGGFFPAFSIYSGLAEVAPFAATQTALPPSADHDFGDASVAWRTWWVKQYLNPAATDPAPTDGSWNALGDWKIGGDGDLPGDFSQLSSFTYRGSVADTNHSGAVTGRFLLAPGDYTIFIGGNDISNKTSDTALSPYGISTTLSVTTTPAMSITSKVFIAWPTSTPANWRLETASSVNATTWTAVPNAPITVDGQLGVLLDSTATQQYFRWSYIP
jgi:hypothetical protein